ncbi:S1 family peptidase (plasmid) [Mesorhizobium sp. AR02]|uniref:S1 family peptidase n=1 Tax=Mesorhizobium sp. AR02 TaxID=2865837 RepID=UPI00215F3CD8|nr:S1 family peptidase [Mesorhizobium sp. AR02]UVK50266.1 S1 family peptidase [Mesorhizobium sp. AR02]
MKQLLAALVFFVVAGPSFAGDVGIDPQIEFGAGLKGAFDGGALTKLNVAPHSIATWSNPSWSDAVHNQPGEGLSFGFDTFDLKPKVTKFHLGFDTPDHCPTCIIFPLDPLPKDAPIKLPPDTLAHLQPGVNAQSVFREAAAWGGDDSEVLGCNIGTSSFLKTLSHKRPEFSWRQFPEVVKLSITRPGTLGVEGCTGTTVGANWVLTAAHCITGKSSAALANNDADQPEEQDFVFSPPTNDQALQINAMNSALVDVDKVRYGDKAIVNKLYDAERRWCADMKSNQHANKSASSANPPASATF